MVMRRRPTAGLRLRRTIKPRLCWQLALDEDESEHAAPDMIAHRASEPVVAGMVEPNPDQPAAVRRKVEHLPLTVGGHEGHVVVAVLVGDVELQLSAPRHDDDSGL